MEIKNIDDLAAKVGLPKFLLTRYMYQADSYYKTFNQKKRSGRGYRRISAPSKELKGIQRWISLFILRQIELPDEACGFRLGYSLKTNASPHLKQDFVCNIDLENFFPTISSKRVFGIFRSLDYPKGVCSALSKLTTFKGRLPQGAPSSPDLSNLVLRRLDRRISGFCKKRSWAYTRYCDDLSISGIGGLSVKELATLNRIIEDEGFAINKEKTRIHRRNRRQEVTGLVVNDHLNLPRHHRKAIRAMFHQAFLYPERFTARLAELEGHLSYLQWVRPMDTKTVDLYNKSLDRVRALPT